MDSAPIKAKVGDGSWSFVDLKSQESDLVTQLEDIQKSVPRKWQRTRTPKLHSTFLLKLSEGQKEGIGEFLTSSTKFTMTIDKVVVERIPRFEDPV